VKRLIYIAFDNLHQGYGALRDANPDKDSIVLVESQRMITGGKWHFQRLFFLISSARHFAEALRAQGFDVHYVKANSTLEGILQIKKLVSAEIVLAVQPSSHKLTEQLSGEVQFIESDFFLTSRKQFSIWAESQKKLLMENFYRAQRSRLKVLIDDRGEPLGGSWNYDQENRQPLPKQYTFPVYIRHEYDELDIKVIAQIRGLDTWGDEPDGTWATTRSGALAQLQNFVDNHLPMFGPYEDAMTSKNWAVHHSLLSPYLNNGLLHPAEVLNAALGAYERGGISLASIEGFVRQLIGWREYINGIYWLFEDEYRESNFWQGSRSIPTFFEDPSKTEMKCMQETMRDIEQRSWVHHIPRLMLISNFAQLAGISPQELLAWMRRVFIDAADWVMVPNVIGMSMNADGGLITSKPYIAGGSYISKMSDYCGSCRFNPKTRSDSDSCPFTTLYWNFIDENFETLAKNQRMAKQVYGINRLKDRAELRERASDLLEEIFG
jgi:deoxyribodipyrimidine photolyase-related protein